MHKQPAGARPRCSRPVEPCRLIDTRAATNVGPRSTPLGANQTATFNAAGTNGNCVLPTGLTGLSANVTATGATADTFLTLFPADGTKPLSSNLNPSPAATVTTNSVAITLSTAGAFKVFNRFGAVDVIIDVLGYYSPSTGGAPGPTGATGDQPALTVRPARPGPPAHRSHRPAGPTGPSGGPVGPTGPARSDRAERRSSRPDRADRIDRGVQRCRHLGA